MGRLIAIGDIHGCAKTLRHLLEEKVQPEPADTLIFLGDYIDRGPNSKDVIDYLIALNRHVPNVVFLRGNHEETLLRAIDTARNTKKGGWFSKPKNEIFDSWLERFGGKEAFISYGITELADFPAEHESWIRATHFYHKTDDYYFVHAGFNFDNADLLSDTDAMLWIREFDYDSQKAGGRKIVHGHVPVTLDFLKECLSKSNLGFVPLDTGCIYKDRIGMGYLSAYDFSNHVLHAVKNVDR